MCWVFWGKGRLHAGCHSGLHLIDWRRDKLELRHIPLFPPSLMRFCPVFSKASELWFTYEDSGVGGSSLPTSRSSDTWWIHDSMQTKHILHQMGTSEIACHEDIFLLFLKTKMVIDFLCGLSIELRLNWTFSFFLFSFLSKLIQILQITWRASIHLWHTKRFPKNDRFWLCRLFTLQ